MSLPRNAMAAIVRATTAALVLVDADDVVVRANPAFHALTGEPADAQLEGLPLAALVDEPVAELTDGRPLSLASAPIGTAGHRLLTLSERDSEKHAASGGVIKRLEAICNALQLVMPATSLDELALSGCQALADPDIGGFAGAAMLWREGARLRLLHSTYPQPGREFLVDADHRYARIARGEEAGVAGAEWMLPLLDPASGEARGHVLLQLEPAARQAPPAGLLALARLAAAHLALAASAWVPSSSLVTTGGPQRLPGPSSFDAALRLEFERSARYERPLAVALISCVDGMETGADQLRDRLRETDLVARLDDQTLGLLLPETALSEAGRAAELLRQRLAGESRSVGAVAIGVAARSWDTASAADLLDHALAALADAREQGGAAFRWEDDGPAEVPRRLATPLC